MITHYRWFMWRMETMALITVTVAALFCVAFKVADIYWVSMYLSLFFRIMLALLLLDWSWSMSFKFQLLFLVL